MLESLPCQLDFPFFFFFLKPSEQVCDFSVAAVLQQIPQVLGFQMQPKLATISHSLVQMSGSLASLETLHYTLYVRTLQATTEKQQPSISLEI